MSKRPISYFVQYISLGAVLALCAALFTYFQWSNELADPDAFYHMRLSQLILERGVITDFIWLPYTTLAEHFIDQHFLYHILMIPFVSTGFPLIGVKIYTVLLAVAFLGIFAVTLKKLESSWWLIVTSVLALTTPFTFRLNLVKATPVALILVCLTIAVLYKKRFWWLVPIGIIYVWAYGGFAMMLIVVITWLIANGMALLTTAHPKKIQISHFLKPLLFTLTGLAIGVVINPYFPNNLSFYWDQLVQIGIINYQDTIGVGAEWYPYNPGRLIFGSMGLISLLLLGLITTILKRRNWQQLDWFALGIFLVGLLLTLKSRRYVEYFGPYTAIAAAIWLRHTVLSWSQVWRAFSEIGRRAVAYSSLGAVAVIVFIPIILSDIRTNKEDIRSGTPINRYESASNLLKNNATPGSKILHSDWDDFPALFFHNSNNAYMSGLDPTFMYRFDKDLYTLWETVTLGEYKGDVTAALTTLDVEYVVIEQNHVDMYNLIQKSPDVALVYTDDEVDIFKVTNWGKPSGY